ncbi:MAG: ABC transporter permease [Candidatus Dormibacteraceae bacterium]
MAEVSMQSEEPVVEISEGAWHERLAGVWRYCRENPALPIGLGIIVLMLLVGPIGGHIANPSLSAPTSVPPDLPPSGAYPLGSDDQGRDLAAVVVAGLPMTFEVGFIAGAIGLVVGPILGFLGGYMGGWVDVVARSAADILLTVPALIVLVTLASTLKGAVTVSIEAFVISALAWMWPTRTIRSQVLPLRERGYVQVAKLSGVRTPELIVKELIPNLLPYLAASFVTSTAAAVLASIGLEAIGLGPQSQPTMGMTVYWAIQFNALIRGLWWWWLTPIVVLGLLFIALFLASSGLDAIANPRAHRAR